MRRIKSDDPQAVAESIKILSDGGIIVYPTDTLYGFGVDATNEDAINLLNNLKRRVGPISVLAPNISVAIGWMDVETNQTDLVPFYLGGSNTLITKAKSNIVSKLIMGRGNTLGIRIPDNVFCNTLSAKFGKPITSTSVNRTSNAPLNNPELIKMEFGGEIDLLVDSGILANTKGSTIYRLNDDNTFEIIRD